MAVVLVCEECQSEYVCSELFPDPCRRCGRWHARFQQPDYVDTITMNLQENCRHVVRSRHMSDRHSSPKGLEQEYTSRIF